MTKEYSKAVEEALKLADETLSEAKALLQLNKLRGSVSRAYYAMFNASRALLYSKDIAVKTHKGVISMLGQYFIKTKEIDSSFSKIIIDTFNLRQATDYEFEVDLGRETVEKIVEDAEKFVKEAKNFLNK